MPSEKWKRLRRGLEKAAETTDMALRGLKIATVITEALGEIDIEPVVFGGAVVAFYTEGRYTTQDIDMVSPSGRDLNEAMENLGFKRLGKDFINKELSIYVKFPGDSLGPTMKFDIIDIDGVPLKIISLEDLIVDQLCAFKYWKSTIDGINALIMIELGKAERDRMERRAREEDVLDALDFVENTLETVIRKGLSPKVASDMLNRFHYK